MTHVTQALAAFERTMVSADSAYDRYRNNRDTTAISPSARRRDVVLQPALQLLPVSRGLHLLRRHGLRRAAQRAGDRVSQYRAVQPGGADRDDLLAFLRSLTDESLLHDPRFSDPWH